MRLFSTLCTAANLAQNDYLDMVVKQFPEDTPSSKISNNLIMFLILPIDGTVTQSLYAIQHLCKHSEYMLPLREEFASSVLGENPRKLDDLCWMDS